MADVKPLGGKSPRRVLPPPEIEPAPVPPRGQMARGPDERLLVDRESNGIVLGRRQSAHPSVIDALEDPKLEVEAECDLHGYTVREAEREVLRFVRECQRGGKRWVRVIVGKGLHSATGKGTLHDEVIEALRRGAPARFILAFRTAPRHLGGTGAFVVRLVDRP